MRQQFDVAIVTQHKINPPPGEYHYYKMHEPLKFWDELRLHPVLGPHLYRKRLRPLIDFDNDYIGLNMSLPDFPEVKQAIKEILQAHPDKQAFIIYPNRLTHERISFNDKPNTSPTTERYYQPRPRRPKRPRAPAKPAPTPGR